MRLLMVCVAFGLMVFGSAAVRAQDAATATPPKSESSRKSEVSVAVRVELNKLEEIKDGCRAYIVVTNNTAKAFQKLVVDLILFRTDGVIGKRVFADLAPLRASKRSVKLFDLSGTKCSEIGSFLVNDTRECRNDEGVVDKCFARLEVSSLTKVTLSK